MLADRTRTIIRAVKAAVANDVSAGIEHVGRADTSAEKTRLPLCLEEAHEHLPPPQLACVAGNIVRETTEQRFVLPIAAYLAE